jgi:hypothetical protein
LLWWLACQCSKVNTGYFSSENMSPFKEMQCIILFDKLASLRTWQQATHSMLPLQFTMNQGPHILVHCIAIDIRFSLTILKERCWKYFPASHITHTVHFMSNSAWWNWKMLHPECLFFRWSSVQGLLINILSFNIAQK